MENKSKKNKSLSVSVSIKDTDAFKEVLKVLKYVIESKKVSEEVKKEVKERLNSISAQHI